MVQVMSTDEHRFRPRLGRPADRHQTRPTNLRSYLKAARKGAKSSGSRRPSNRQGLAGARRVYLQARIQRLSGSGGALQRAHISYLEREGAGRGEARAEFYNDRAEGLSGQDWLKDHADERHHFRFIVSPEDGERLEGLKPFIRDLVGQMEIDLETRLDWVAVDHFNTEHPHTHIVMSGKREDGQDLVIPREYLSSGIRERGSALLTRDLGLQTEQELSAKLEQEIGQRKMTRMDRMLLRQMETTGEIDLSRVTRNWEHYGGRLKALRRMGLAEHISGTRWEVDDGLGRKLHAIAHADTVERRIEMALQERGLERLSAPERSAYDPAERLTGRLLKVGYADELIGSRYGIVDGLDGRAHHVALGTQIFEGLNTGDMIEVKPRASGALKMDREIAQVAAQNDGVYSAAAHQRYEPAVRRDYLSMFERRLDALEQQGLVTTSVHGRRQIAPDFMDKVNDHAAALAKRAPSLIRKLEGRDFEAQVKARGETWLDQQLAGTAPEPLSEAGLGGEVRGAMAKRMAVHIERGLVSDRSVTQLSQGHLIQLQREGMRHAATDIAKQTGRDYRALQPGEQIDGRFTQTVSTAHAKFAIVERGYEFSLVPWKDSLEKLRGHHIQISVSRSMDMTWTRGRSRGLSR
jgi:type IV secretory pathway VirD2 relaxase